MKQTILEMLWLVGLLTLMCLGEWYIQSVRIESEQHICEVTK